MAVVVPANLLTAESLLEVGRCLALSSTNPSTPQDMSPDALVLLDWCIEHGVNKARTVTPSFQTRASKWERFLATPLNKVFLPVSAACLLHELEMHLPKKLPVVRNL